MMRMVEDKNEKVFKNGIEFTNGREMKSIYFYLKTVDPCCPRRMQQL